ncbi:acyclic terpene utilization AtuA family protein [Pseudomonas sp. Marseille-QA0892]
MTTTIHVGCGAGFANDRPDAARALAEDLASRQGQRYLMFELLAERTLAEAQMRRLTDPDQGYASRLFDFLEPVLPICLSAGIPIITNGGAANPRAAAVRLRKHLAEGPHAGARIACVLGDDLLSRKNEHWIPHPEDDRDVVSVNVYIGADGIVDALSDGADIVLCGRVADPSLAVGAIRHGLGWSAHDWDRMAIATAAGHLLECCTQVTGGYFAHPSIKDVPDLANLGCPIAEISDDGTLVIGKTANTGGCVNVRTVREQLLYEVHDPAAYLTPDVVMDLSEATAEPVGPDRVAIRGIRGSAQPETLKGLMGLRGLWFGEGEISYAGPGALARARLARDILLERFGRLAPGVAPWIDLSGVASLFNDQHGRYLDRALQSAPEMDDVRLRVGLVHVDRTLIDALLQDVESLYTNGPAGGGGVRRHVSEALGTQNFLLPREAITTTVEWF